MDSLLTASSAHSSHARVRAAALAELSGSTCRAKTTRPGRPAPAGPAATAQLRCWGPLSSLPPAHVCLRLPRGNSGRASPSTVAAAFNGDELYLCDPQLEPAAMKYFSPEELWLKLLACEKSLRVAVEVENYELAVKLRDQQAQLMDSLSVTQRYILELVRKLQKAEERAELLDAISCLAEVGHGYDAVPALSEVLHSSVMNCDPELEEATSQAMWDIFMRSSNPKVNALMETGTRFMQLGDMKGSLAIFTEIIHTEPSFAEGYNKRATVLYMMGQYDDSVADCQMVLDTEPLHFGAMSGLGLCLLKMGELEGALQAFDRALQTHPGLTEIRNMADDLRARLNKPPAV